MQGLSHGTYTSRATVKLRDICCTVEGSLTTAHIETHSPLYMCSVALPDSRASHSGKEVQEKCGGKHAHVCLKSPPILANLTHKGRRVARGRRLLWRPPSSSTQYHYYS